MHSANVIGSEVDKRAFTFFVDKRCPPAIWFPCCENDFQHVCSKRLLNLVLFVEKSTIVRPLKVA